jgi:hypothetical protein
MRNSIPLLFLLLLASCREKSTVFEALSPGSTGIDFNNYLEESDDLNVLNYTYFYNGGGVAIGDLDNDGRPDIVFTGNMVRNKIFINKGGMDFDDITSQSGIADKQGWCTGVTLADVNADGWLDIYICRSADVSPERRTNLLFINNRDHTFSEQAAAFGLADPGYSSQAAFFDYDRDGDLDCAVINHSLKKYTTGVSDNPQLRQEENPYFGSKLYRNDNGRFTDVSKQAGITSNVLSFGLGLVVSDFNTDGWPDFFISNDFNEPDYLFINRKDGTFSEEAPRSLTQHSLYSMGADAGDIDHDGLPDLVTLDMLPESNFDQKMHSGAENFDKFRYLFSKGFHNQYSRNMLHLNMGGGRFSEIGQLAGISNTDWSWAALLKDFDNDGQSDLFVTNGYVRDYTDMDFIKYSFDRQVELQQTGGSDQSLMEYIKKMPGHPLSNYMFRYEGGYRFRDVSRDWGFDKVGVFSGASAGDLDGDGDLDLVLTVTNDKAVVYENHSADATPGKGYLRFRLQGTGANTLGIGAVVDVHARGVRQRQEHHLTRGFQSAMEPVMHFGLGDAPKADSVRVTWPDGRTQLLRDISAGTIVDLRQQEAQLPAISGNPPSPLYRPAPDVSYAVGDRFQSDLSVQPSLINFLGNVSPILAATDLDGDGREDIVTGGTRMEPTRIRATRAGLITLTGETQAPVSAIVTSDLNGDGRPDLLIGRNAYGPDSLPGPMLQVWLNTGGRSFQPAPALLPAVMANIGCIALDTDSEEGLVRIFAGARVRQGMFPLSDPSRIFVLSAKGSFLREESLPEGSDPGMYTGAQFLQLDGKGGRELLMVGEFRSPGVFASSAGKWVDVTKSFIPEDMPGWWTSILRSDLDGDGDEDLLLGNYGLNTQFRVSPSEPFTVLSKDFDGNGKLDAVSAYFIGGKSWPAHSLDDLWEQMPFLRKRFNTYAAYAKTEADGIFTPEERKDAIRLTASEMRTLLLENTGGSMKVHELPIQAQFAPVFASAAFDADGDGRKDLLLCGNQSGTRIRYGKYDANTGFLFRNEGGMRFSFVPHASTGLDLRGDVRSVVVTDRGARLWFGVNGVGVQSYDRSR